MPLFRRRLCPSFNSRFLAHLTDRHKAAKLKGDGWLPGTYAFLTPQPLGPGDTVWLHQFVPPSAAAPPAPVAPAPAAAPVAAPAPALNESKKRPRSPLPTTPTGGATGGGVFVPHSPESAPPPTTTTTSNGTGAAAGLRTHQQAGSGGDEETTLAARPPSPPGLPPPRPPSPPGYPPGHPACSSFAAGAAVAAGTAAGPNAGAGQNTPDGDHLVSRPSSPQGFPPPRPSSPSGLPPGASAPQPVAFAPHSPESAPPAPPTSSASLPSGQQPPPQPQQPLPCWSVGRPPSPEHAPPGWRGPTLKRGELPPPFPQQAQQTPLPQSQPPQQQQQQAQPCLSPLAVPPRTSSSMQAAPPQPSQVATSTAASSSWGSDQQTAANAYSKLVMEVRDCVLRFFLDSSSNKLAAFFWHSSPQSVCTIFSFPCSASFFLYSFSAASRSNLSFSPVSDSFIPITSKPPTHYSMLGADPGHHGSVAHVPHAAAQQLHQRRPVGGCSALGGWHAGLGPTAFESCLTSPPTSFLFYFQCQC